MQSGGRDIAMTQDESTETSPPEKVIELRLPSRLGYERVAMDAASSLAKRMGFQRERIDALKTAVSEAVTNAIEHGNQHDEAMKVMVFLTARDDELVIDVVDRGQRTIDRNREVKTPDIRDKMLDNVDRGGWGFWLIQELMDEVEVSVAPSGGNQVRMVIHLEQG